MRAILTLALKDLKLLFRDGFALFWVFAFPLMYALFFGSLFGNDDDGSRGRIAIAVVDEDGSEASAQLIGRLAEHESIRLPRQGAEEDALPALSTLEEARALVRKGSRTAYLRIPAGYGVSPFALFGGGDDSPGLEVGIDPSRSAEAGFLQGILMEVVFGGMGETFLDPDLLKREIARAREEVAVADDLGSVQKLALQTFFAALETFVEDVDLEALAAEAGDDGSGGMDLGALVEVVDVTRERGHQPRSAFDEPQNRVHMPLAGR